MKRPIALWIALGGVIAVAAIGVGVRRGRATRATDALPGGALRGANVLLVTIDTLRADRVGAYGSARGLTPTLDRLAAEGLRFATAYAHVPLTLPSHASLMTAVYPARNGVRDNGVFRLAASMPTLATALQRAGYRTGAFVAAVVLDARYGLGRGFDAYDDRMLGDGRDLAVVQRNAEQVLAPAAAWIATARTRDPVQPWFAWIHLYDPHAPYAPPEPYRARYAAEPYDGEIAYADAALGSFVATLRGDGTLEHTLMVIASDHGESLGEHGERTHGLFAYDSTLRVPLIMWAPPRIAPGVFGETMRLVDVAPTVLDLIGAEPMAGVDGRSARPFISGERPFDRAASYFEALNANLTRGWAPLTGVVRDRMKLIDLPVPELYDLASDPGEQRNVYARQRERARDLETRLDQIMKGAAPLAPVAIDADAEARLRSLGYVVGPSAKPSRTYTAADDPKTLVHLDAALDAAAALWARGDADAAIETLRGVIRERPDLTIAYDRLAVMLRATGRLGEGIALLDAAARNGHADRVQLRALGSMVGEAGDLARSAAILDGLVRADATDLEAADALGQTYARMGRGQMAETLFRRVLAASPNAAETWNNLGALLLAEGRDREAIDALTNAVAINPDLAGAHNGLGVAWARQGRTGLAIGEWQKTLALRPGDRDAQFNLDRLRTKK